MNTILIFCLVAGTQGLDDEDSPTITTLPNLPEFRITEKTKVEMIIKSLRQDDVDRASDLALHLPNGTAIGELEKVPKPGDSYIILTSLEACKKQGNLYITYTHYKSATDSSVITWRVDNISYIPSVHAKVCTEAPVDTWHFLTSPPKLYYILGGGGVFLISLLVLAICCCHKRSKKGGVFWCCKKCKEGGGQSQNRVDGNPLYGEYYMGDVKMQETEVGILLCVLGRPRNLLKRARKKARIALFFSSLSLFFGAVIVVVIILLRITIFPSLMN